MDAKITAANAAKFLNISLQAVHKRLKKKKLPYAKSQNRIYFGHNAAREIFQLNIQKKIVAFENIKGGVGKTEIAYACAIASNLYGLKILLIDADMQGNITVDCLRFNPENSPILVDILERDIPIKDSIINISEGFDLIPSRIENCALDSMLMMRKYPLDRIFKENFQQLINDYDLIVVDCNPSLNHTFTAISLAVNEVIAPITPDSRSISGMKRCYAEIKNIEKRYQTKINFKVVLNQFDTRNSLSHEMLDYIAKDNIFGPLRYRTYIRRCQEFPNAIANGETVFKTLRETPAKEDIDLFVKEMLGIDGYFNSFKNSHLDLKENFK